MYQLIETIRLIDGIPMHLAFHQDRLNRSYRDCFGKAPHFLLEKLIHCPEDLNRGLVKCRVVYDPNGVKLEYFPYTITPARIFKLVYPPDLNYSYKFEDRKQLDQLFAQKGNADDIIIVKDGWVTDSYYANLVLTLDGNTFFTPDKPLLAGTKRAFYLQSGLIQKKKICVETFFQFSHFKRINAMLDLEDTDWVKTSSVIG